MATNTATISVIRGDDQLLNITFYDAIGARIDITGYTVYFTVKESLKDSDDKALITVDQTSHTDPINGETTVELTQANTDITEGDYYFDFQIKDLSNKISSTHRGTFTVTNDVTKRVA